MSLTSSPARWLLADRRCEESRRKWGMETWRVKLPAIGGSTPITYISPKSGRQFVVTAAGGHFSLKGPKASAIVAYALPKP